MAGQAGDAVHLLRLVEDERPELVIIDIRMPPTQSTEGLEAARAIRERHPDLGILVLSAYVEVEDALELLAGGGSVTCSRAGSRWPTSSSRRWSGS